MTKRLSRIIACFMLLTAIGFLLYALGHPEAAFPWSNTVTYLLYAVYLITMIVLFIAPFKR